MQARANYIALHPTSRLAREGLAREGYTPRVRVSVGISKHSPNPKSSQNRASKAIDQGDTIAELRKAWGIPERE